jgi:hypothetical protein
MSEFARPVWAEPVRVLIVGSANAAWYDASESERTTEILPRFEAILSRWTESGARLIGSFDDDLFMVGRPESFTNSMYMLFDVENVATVVEMVHMFREVDRGVRLDKFIRIEARLGRRLFLLDK